MKQAFLTVDLGFGDAGKGSVVDYLTRAAPAHTVIRYNGGAQAGHRVVTPDTPSRSHVFAQFGSGALAGAATHLSRWMLLDPLAMDEEETHLRTLGVADAYERTTVDAGAVIVTPFQRAVNRLKEWARGAGRHGSCGMGIGETMSDWLAHGPAALLAGDLWNPQTTARKLTFLQAANRAKLAALPETLRDHEAAAREWRLLHDDDVIEGLAAAYQDWSTRAHVVSGNTLQRILGREGTVIFEGAQGVLLDEWGGFHPHTTWSTTTLRNAFTLLHEANYRGEVQRVGISRGYLTRHGAGPLVTGSAALSQALPDAANSNDGWQGAFRVGWLDLVLLRYAAELTGPLDWLALTCLDRLQTLPELAVCPRYHVDGGMLERLTPSPTPRDLVYQEGLTRLLARSEPLLQPVASPAALPALAAEAVGAPVKLLSYGPTAADKQAR